MSRKSSTVISLGAGFIIVWVVLAVGFFTGWVLNAVALCGCDFEPSYKAETIRTIGVVVPPVGAIAGYIDIADGPTQLAQ